MTKLLWISFCAPYKQVAHAGGKNHYYWLKKIEEDESFDVKLITCCTQSEVEAVEAMNYPFEVFCCVGSNNRIGKIWQKIQSMITVHSYLFRFVASIAMYKIIYIKKVVRKLKRQGYVPDTILLHWTQIGLLYDWISIIFPSARIVVMEEDVSFLRTQRDWNVSRGISKKAKQIIHKIMYAREIKMCEAVDCIVVTNRKDVEILIDSGISEAKLLPTISYFQNLSDIKPQENSHKILFYGAMNRKENIEAAVWFAEKVMPELRKRLPLEFVILGGNPTEEVKRLGNGYIHVTGFVEDIKPYFQDALCLVAPLFNGAGIKIKILEGMSSGIPVLTNEIGIEGIGAIDKKEYYHCESVEDFVSAINSLYSDFELVRRIGNNGRVMVLKHFNSEDCVEKFKEVLKS